MWTNLRVTHTLLTTQPITIVYNYPPKPLKSVYQENTPAPVWTHRHVGEAFPSVNFRFLYDYCFYLRFIYTQRKRTRKQIFSFDISSLLNVSIKLDSVWTHLEVMSLSPSLSRQYKPTLTKSLFRVEPKRAFVCVCLLPLSNVIEIEITLLRKMK